MSTLAEVRRAAAVASRRHDLLLNSDLDSGKDGGMDTYINEALRFLDQRVEHPKQFRRHPAVVSSGDIQFEVPRLISVQRLYLKGTTGVTDLTEYYVEPEQFRSNTEKLITSWTNGKPCWWTLNDTLLSPSLEGTSAAALTADGAVDVSDLDHDLKWDTSFIIFNPPANASYTFDVLGRFYSNPLKDDEDKNFWTVMHPDLLEIVTCYMLEMRMQNSTRQATWERAITAKIREIEGAFVEREIAGGKGIVNG